MPGCKPGDLARLISGPARGSLVHVDRDADLEWVKTWSADRWFVITMLQPPPAVDLFGTPWDTNRPTVAGDSALVPIRPDELDKADPRDVPVSNPAMTI